MHSPFFAGICLTLKWNYIVFPVCKYKKSILTLVGQKAITGTVANKSWSWNMSALIFTVIN